ncbi:MAG: hypothetical protein KGH78_02540 [Candidatus Micrarchaeota archaeon]|nr:hypothetical protein [Candidatus Micrarchaeota archaeon]
MRLPVVVALFILLVSLTAWASSATVSATLQVISPCPYSVSTNALPTYPRVGNVMLYYTLQATGSCNPQNAIGTFSFTESDNSNQVYSQSLTSNMITSTAATNSVSFNTMTLGNTLFSALFYFTYNSVAEEASQSITLENPPNLTISGLSVPSSITSGSPLDIQLTIKNIGQYAASNIVLYVTISGAGAQTNSYSVPSLSPGQSTQESLALTNPPSTVGSYTLSVYTTYTTLNSNLNTSATSSAQYSVTSSTATGPSVGGASGGGAVSAATNPISVIPSLLLESVPIYAAASVSNPSISLLSMQNTGTQLEQISMSIPSAFSNFLSLSEQSFNLQPGQSTAIQIFASPTSQIANGTYIVPLQMKLNSAGTTANQTQYLTFNIYHQPKTHARVINQISIRNYTQTAVGVIQISNPTPDPMSNMTLQTLIPLGVALNLSDISTSGLPANVTDPPGYYTITWSVPYIAPGGSVFTYYSIENPQSLKLISGIQNILASPSAPAPSSILKLVNIAFPTFRTNTTQNITVYALYTGTSQAPVQFTLTSPSGITIQNPTKVLGAAPNQLLSPSFQVSSGGHEGTYILNLYISAQGFNASYSLPLIVLNPGAGQQGATTTVSQAPILGFITQNLYAARIVFALIIIAVVIIILFRSFGQRPRYHRETSEQLVRLREQIKRSENE